MLSQSKPRRVKTPSSMIRDKFEGMKKPEQSELPEPVRSEPEPVETKKKTNAWINHVKSIAQSKNIMFRDALRDPATKATYKK